MQALIYFVQIRETENVKDTSKDMFQTSVKNQNSVPNIWNVRKLGIEQAIPTFVLAWARPRETNTVQWPKCTHWQATADSSFVSKWLQARNGDKFKKSHTRTKISGLFQNGLVGFKTISFNDQAAAVLAFLSVPTPWLKCIQHIGTNRNKSHTMAKMHTTHLQKSKQITHPKQNQRCVSKYARAFQKLSVQWQSWHAERQPPFWH